MTTFLQSVVYLLAEKVPLWYIPSNEKKIAYITKPKVFFFFALFDSHKNRLPILGPLTNLKTFFDRDIVTGHLPLEVM